MRCPKCGYARNQPGFKFCGACGQPLVPQQHQAQYSVSAPAAKLVIQSHYGAGKEYSLNQPISTIGRSPHNFIVLQDERVSRQHAEIRGNGSNYVISDLGSSNGTLVNGQRIAQHPLQTGDRITIGDTDIVFYGLINAAATVADMKQFSARKVSPVASPSPATSFFDKLKPDKKGKKKIVTDQRKILKELEKIGGAEIDQGQMIITSSGNQAWNVRTEFLRMVRQRNIPGADIQEFSQEYTLVKKIVRKKENVMMAVRIEPYGNDLLIGMRHYEWSSSNDFKRMVLGMTLFMTGGLFFWTGIGLMAALAGFGILRSKATLSGTDHEESLLFKGIVMETVILALDNCGISYPLPV